MQCAARRRTHTPRGQLLCVLPVLGLEFEMQCAARRRAHSASPAPLSPPLACEAYEAANLAGNWLVTSPHGDVGDVTFPEPPLSHPLS
jgi:hypothetical protein